MLREGEIGMQAITAAEAILLYFGLPGWTRNVSPPSLGPAGVGRDLVRARPDRGRTN